MSQSSSGAKPTRKKRRRKTKQSQAKQIVQFWGDPSELPEPSSPIRVTGRPDAVISSIGRPPFPGHEAAAEQYFSMVYTRAVSLSSALAAAAELVEDDQQ